MNAHKAAMYKAKMERAFQLVDPKVAADKLVLAGILPSHTKTWRDEIAELVLDSELAAARVTIADVLEAIEFFTATTAKVQRANIGQRAHESYSGDGRPGYLVIAPGYRNGPAA